MTKYHVVYGPYHDMREKYVEADRFNVEDKTVFFYKNKDDIYEEIILFVQMVLSIEKIQGSE